VTLRATDIPDWALDAVSELPPLATEKQTAALLRKHPKTLQRWRRAGKVIALRTSPAGSGQVLYPRLEVARLLTRMVEGA
jgi:hypothetical protein